MITSVGVCSSDENSLSGLSTFKNERFKAVLEEMKLEYPYTDARLLQTYFRKLSARNIMPRQRRNTGNNFFAILREILCSLQ